MVSEQIQGDATRPMQFEFTGSGGEYFKIWLVNIFLTILTLGIYSAWAKVRKNRYFYGNTRLGDSSFDYLANPVAILKGRLIAFLIFAIYVAVATLLPAAELLFGLVFLGVLPWLVVKSLAFRARNTAFRNIRFDFRGDYGAAARVYILLPILLPFTLGLIYPVIVHGQKDLVVSNSAYGTTGFRFEAGAGNFYRIFGMLFLIGAAAIVLLAMLFPVSKEAGMITALPLYLFFFAFMTCHISNLVYNKSFLEQHSLQSDLKVYDVFMLYLTNTIAIVLTLGLFIPWANVRLARYRAERLQFIAAGDLDGFVARELEKISGTGEEMGEMFDVDVGL